MRRPALLLLVTALAGCAAVPAPGGQPLLGLWGGRHIGLTLTADGGRAEHDCADGRIDGPLLPGAGGRFEAAGSHSPGHGGPEGVGEVHRSYPARYSGTLRGDEMELVIDVPERSLRIGPYALRRGAEPLLTRCL